MIFRVMFRIMFRILEKCFRENSIAAVELGKFSGTP